ncbi:TATA box binding protein associated factor [Plectosphaerella cucumerina]|uniref:TBP-associated factor 6 n=1 Tax=Plectosphaerella cucumerina TaxID=40658 RepID=A0A8K0X7J2_9PEZI|nr:TATA box binding protein associated factor [Plectosphaerella cucumerina]
MMAQPPQQQSQPPAQSQQPPQQQAPETKLLWNPENVKDVAESVGISALNDDALRVLAQDVEYRIGQVTVEALRFMRAARRTTLTVGDISQALKVLDVEPLYGYDSTRPLRFGEASLGPGQPLFYIEDEEIDFEKLINAPLPKVPRDMNFTAHWLAIEGVQPSIPQNPTTAESRSQELLPKGPGANPAMAALAGNDNISFRPTVKHIISKELVLYFEKVQAALLDDNPDEEVVRLRQAALASVRSDPGLHQLIPYFVNFVSNQVTHRLDDTFVLRRVMELTEALIQNTNLFLDPYANSIAAPVLTCLLGRKLGPDESRNEQYELREFSASLLGQLATRYAASNHLLRPKLVRTCLKFFMDPDKPAATHFGAITGLAAAGGPEAIRVLVLRHLKPYNDEILARLREKGDKVEFEMLVGGIVKAILSMANDDKDAMNGVNGAVADAKTTELKEFIGSILGARLAALGNRKLIDEVLDARNIQ